MNAKLKDLDLTVGESSVSYLVPFRLIFTETTGSQQHSRYDEFANLPSTDAGLSVAIKDGFLPNKLHEIDAKWAINAII